MVVHNVPTYFQCRLNAIRILFLFYVWDDR